jgi:hypothetical protein
MTSEAVVDQWPTLKDVKFEIIAPTCQGPGDQAIEAFGQES